ncbi:MAG: sigma-54-dependent Fis family transcriptional regulator [Alphaproteobacteria bacterium]|nr:MAG: sigma-54-dependent Fis family transcriptional regulator [Alphaproteobacteria bacterium]
MTLSGRRILLVEDDPIMGGSLAQRLELEGAEVLWVRQVVRAIPEIRVARAPVDAVICDIRLPDGTGEEIFARISATMTPPPFLFITGQGDIEQAVRLMRAGADDYITKPFEMSVFLERLSLLMRPRETIELPQILGVTRAAQRIHRRALAAAQREGNVIILGAAGTGKTAIARLIHDRSDRRAAPLVVVNLARESRPETALSGPGGALERTRDGVLVLLALERMPAPLQADLLAALDAGFEGRIVSTGRPELRSRPEGVGVRPDLLARLGEIEIAIPPLAERSEDAVWLMREFFAFFNARRPTPLKGISALTEDAARAHDWPGNGREVRSRVRRAVEGCEGEWLFPVDLFPETQADPAFLTLTEAREAAERRQIVAALERSGGQMSEAARLLKISRTTLWERMQKFGL